MRRAKNHPIAKSILYALQIWKRHLLLVCSVCAGCLVTDNLKRPHRSVKYYAWLRSPESAQCRYGCCNVDINTSSLTLAGEGQSSAIPHPCFIKDVMTPGMDHLGSPIPALSNATHPTVFTSTHMLCLAHDPLSTLNLTLSLCPPCFSET